MKIIIDIGHPAHVHYFKHVIKIFKNRGHEICIIAREREFIFELLNELELPYINRGTGRNSLLGKFFYMFSGSKMIFSIAKKFKPDLFLSFSSPYAAQAAFLMRKPHIALNDTEHEDTMFSVFTYPFSSVILTPKSFLNTLGNKQIRFDNLVEGLYLHPNYYFNKNEIKKHLGVKEDDEYVLLRFVSWNAHHDFRQSGLTMKTKMDLIKILSKNYKVFISSETVLPKELLKYKLPSTPERIHDVISSATLFIGESSTMASESAFLGTYAVFISSLPLMCNIKTGQDAGLIKQFKSNDGVIEYIENLLANTNLKLEAKKRSIIMQSNFIDATKFLAWFVENYPESLKIMQNDPMYQYNFR